MSQTHMFEESVAATPTPSVVYKKKDLSVFVTPQLKKQIAQKTKEMQKLVLESEYFRNITYDDIDKKLRLMDEAIKDQHGPETEQERRI